jgi:hypothetical protein
MFKHLLYRLVPVDIKDSPDKSSQTASYPGAMVPMAGTLSINEPAGMALGEMLGKDVICSLSMSAGGKVIHIAEAIVNITKKKYIVSTRIVGGAGTVKEFIGEDDMAVDIVLGIAATDELGNIIDEYPEAQMRDLIEMLDMTRIDVYSPFLELFDLDGGLLKLVVTDYSVSQSTHTNRQAVSINAITDYDYVIFEQES